MAQILRKEGVVFLRDSEGKHTAITFRTEKVERIWVSNHAIRNLCVAAVLITAMLTGTMEKSLAVPDKLATWMLRGAIK
jgi:hypothetical protein